MHSPAAIFATPASPLRSAHSRPARVFVAPMTRTCGMTGSNHGLCALHEDDFRHALHRIRERPVKCCEHATDPFKGKVSEDDPGPLGEGGT